MGARQLIKDFATFIGTVLLTKKIGMTKWTATQPVTKQLRLSNTGSVEKTSTANQLYEGTITRIECSPMGFLDVLKNIGPHDCLSYALPVDPMVSRLVSRSKYRAGGQHPDTTTRTADKMAWPDGPAIFMGDYDPRDGHVYSSADLREAVYLVCPAMREAAHVWAASSSSCLTNNATNKMVSGIKGQRLYVVVADGADIPRAGAVFCKRSWLNGQGYIAISKAGSLLVRSILDGAVFQPNRIDYCAPPICVPPLVSKKPNPKLYGNSRLAVDTQVALPDLTDEEEATYNRLVTSAKDAARAQAASIRADYQKQQIAKLVSRGIDQGTAEKVIMQGLESDVLLADFPLLTDTGQAVTVGEILQDKARWHRTHFADPIEPDYHDDHRIATAFLIVSGHPHIYSFAHGGRRYNLSHNVMTIQLEKGQRSPYMDKIVDSFLATDQFYRRGSKLVSIAEDGAIVAQSYFQILKAMDRQFRFEKYIGNKWAPADVGTDIAKMLGEAYVQRFPPLKAVLSAPIMVPETGRLITTSGYDSETALCLRIDGGAVQLPKNFDIADMREALRILWWAVRLFPFSTPVDETVMLTGLLTAVIRPLLPTAPGFAFDAPIQASGKTLLIKVLAALSGHPPTISPQPDGRNDDELRKRLFAELLGGHSVIVIDNIVGEFDSPALAAFLTSEEYSDRVLKESRIETLSTNALLLMSGNNLILKGDLPRRILRCRIDPNDERPHQRHFDFDPAEVMRADRPQIVVAALILFRGFLANAQATRHGAGRTASFEVWDDTVRQTVCWLASLQQAGSLPRGKTPEDDYFPCLTDPMDAINNAVSEDSARSQLGRLLHAWAEEIGTGTTFNVTAKKLFAKSTELTFSHLQLAAAGASIDVPVLKEVIVEIAGNHGTGMINYRTLGKALAKYKDRITDGLCLRQGDPHQGSLTWWVEDMAPVTPVSLKGG